MTASVGFTDVLLPPAVRGAVPFLIPFGVIGLWRWTLFLLRVVFWLLYRPVVPRKNADGTSAHKYTSKDCTVIVPTIDNGPEFVAAAERWKVNGPAEVIVVTVHGMKKEIENTCAGIDPGLFRVLCVSHPNKRVQVMKGVHAAKTPIVALSDDDAIWTEDFLEWMLAPFDSDEMGGVGSRQEMMPAEVGKGPTMWEVFGDFRLSMRMIEASATTFVDGGISCLSGRTAVYRREILADPEFAEKFVNETWLGKYHLHSGDDKFITRWLVSHRWKMQFQNHPKASLKTTFRNDVRFLKQVIRWTRNTWRSDIRSLFIERYIWCAHPYVCFNMWDKFINAFALLYGVFGAFFILFGNSTYGTAEIVIPVLLWLLVSRCIRLLPHLIMKPTDIVYVPAFILFQYFFAVMKLYAVCTLHVTGWGSRDMDPGEKNDETTPSEEIHKEAAPVPYFNWSSSLSNPSTVSTSGVSITIPKDSLCGIEMVWEEESCFDDEGWPKQPQDMTDEHDVEAPAFENELHIRFDGPSWNKDVHGIPESSVFDKEASFDLVPWNNQGVHGHICQEGSRTLPNSNRPQALSNRRSRF